MRLTFGAAAVLLPILASAQCIPSEYMQYKDKAMGADGVRALARDICMVKIGMRGAIAEDNAKATRRDPTYLKNSDACIAEIRKIGDAAKAAGIANEVQEMSKTLCPGK